MVVAVSQQTWILRHVVLGALLQTLQAEDTDVAQVQGTAEKKSISNVHTPVRKCLTMGQ